MNELNISQILPNKKLLRVLAKAYQPCPKFGICAEAKFDPSSGHIPRGFIGATAALEDVKVIFLFSEPGHPHINETYPDTNSVDLLAAGVKKTYESFKNSTDKFHENTRWVMNQIWNHLSFDEQLKYVWLTEGRLCSISKEIGWFNDKECAKFLLLDQIKLLPNATIIAFGNKAMKRLNSIKKFISNPILTAYALAPPGANHHPAKPSWISAIENIKEKEYSS